MRRFHAGLHEVDAIVDKPAARPYPGASALVTQIRKAHPRGVGLVLIGQATNERVLAGNAGNGIIVILIGLLLLVVQKFDAGAAGDLAVLKGGDWSDRRGDGRRQRAAGRPARPVRPSPSRRSRGRTTRRAASTTPPTDLKGRLARAADGAGQPPPALVRRQVSEQNFTSSQHRAQRRRQLMGRPQATQGLWGRADLLPRKVGGGCHRHGPAVKAGEDTVGGPAPDEWLRIRHG